MAKEYVSGTPLEQLAAKTLDSAYERNKQAWRETHNKQYRLYQKVRGINLKKGKGSDGGDSYHRKGNTKKVKSTRSNIQLGMMWMLHNIAYSIVSQSLIESDELMELDNRRGQEIAFLKEMGEYVEDLFTDDIPNIKESAREALWDLLACGASCLCPSWRSILKRIIQRQSDENGEEQLVDTEIDFGEYPIFDVHAPWA